MIRDYTEIFFLNRISKLPLYKKNIKSIKDMYALAYTQKKKRSYEIKKEI